MKSLGRVWRRFSKRHAEAIFIIAFILADCFLSGWALTLGSITAILYVLMPAIRTLPTLNAVGRITFLKAFVKTEKVHRLAVLLFWIYSVRLLLYAASAANLFTNLDSDGKLPSLSNVFLNGAQEWAPLAYLSSPIFIYVAACLTAITLRARLKTTAKDPDLIMQRQKWAGMTHVVFTSAFIGSILSITMNVHGPSYMLSNWLLVSAQDANILTFKKSISMDELKSINRA
ncbi:MAG: hypothetical protein K2X81_02130, partial [Candidatus Obscuribacterales bacterium]|nr:hypothetical protein [Candidatus Obscuribacterales bacterium]